MKNKIRLIQSLELISFILFALAVAWVFVKGINSVITDPLSWNHLTVFGYTSLLFIAVFIAVPVYEFLKSKLTKK
jgi:uncharacterized membrane protein AbrB (regulator of aidB expression)